MKTTQIPFLILFVLLFGCTEESKPEATINYYLSAESSADYELLSFNFDHTRAYKSRRRVIRTVYLDPKRVSYDLRNPQPIFLGSSPIEPQNINGFDFGLSHFEVINSQQDTLNVNLVWNFNDYSDFSFTPAPNETIDITFTLDLDASIFLDANDRYQIGPIVHITK